MKLVLLFFCAIQALSISAQPSFGWADHAGTGSDQHGLNIVGDNNGNVFATGYIHNGNNFFESNQVSSVGGNDVFLAKYNSSGNGIWVIASGGSGDDEGNDVAVDNAGSIYVCGYFSGTATFFGTPNVTLTSGGGKDIFVAKYNSLGNILWAKKAGGAGPNDIAYALCTNGTDVFVTGTFGNTATFGLLPTLVSSGPADIFIASYNCSTGSENWAIKGGSSAGDEGHGIAVDASGIYVSGYYGNATCTFQNQTGSLANNGGNDIFVVKYDLAGNGIWTRRAGSSGPDQSLSVCVNRTFVYVGGFFNSTMNLYNSSSSVASITSSSGDDAFLIQYNSNTGNFNWVKSENGIGIDRSYAIASDPGGFVFCTGYFDGTLPLGSGPSFTSDHEGVFVTSYDSTGTFLWGNVADGNDMEIATGISAPDNNSIYISGYFKNGPVSFGTHTINSYGNDDIFVAALPCVTTTAAAGSDQTICSSSSSFAANTAVNGTGTWSLISGNGVIVSPNSPISSVTNLGIGANVFQWTISNGTCPPSSDQVTINVDANPTTSNAGIDQTICSTNSSFSGNSPTVGIGTWTLISGTGIIVSSNSPTSAVTNLGVGADVFQWTISNGTCPSTSDQVTINVDANPTTANAGIDQTICSTSTSLTGNSPTVGIGTWTLISGTGTITSINSPTSSVTNLGIGANVFQWTISNGTCPPSSDQVTINVDANPTTSNAGIDQTICSTNSSFSGNSPTVGTGTWTLISGTGTITSINSPTSSVTNLGIGANVFQWTISNGTCPPSSDQVTINVDANPTTSNAGIDQTICSTNSSFSGNSPTVGTGTWTLISGTGTITSINSPTSSVTNLGIGANVFQWTISNGTCPPSSDQVTINVDANPTTANAGIDRLICDSSDTLEGNIPIVGSGLWYPIGNSATFNNASLPNAIVNNLSVGANYFEWVISNGTCPSSRDTLFINYSQPPSAPFAGTDIFECQNSVVLQAQSPSIGNGFWINISGAGNISDTANPNSLVTNIPDGIYYYTWTTVNGYCVSHPDTVAVNIFSPPTSADAGTDQELFAPYTSLHANSPSVGIGNWSLVSGAGQIENPADPQTRVSSLGDGQNVFRWTITNGVCAATSDEMIVQKNALVIPTGYSPNGDNVNDEFEIKGLLEYQNVSMEIFNRWGNKVFSSANYRNDWNGVGDNNQILPDDIYYFVLTFDDGTAVNGYVAIKRTKT